MTFNPRNPYNDLPLLPAQAELETRDVFKQCIAATRALAELKGSGGLIPDQAILINSIPLQEARLSSEIENIVTTQDELFRAAMDDTASTDPQTKEILRYRAALRYGYDFLKEKEFDLEFVLKVCTILMGRSMQFRKEEEKVFIGNRVRGSVSYTPPDGGSVLQDKLGNWIKFLTAKDGPDPLIRMAAAHYQFEAIHPFVDGNGRTGRILNILYLINTNLLEIPVLYLSRYIIRNKQQYYSFLRGVTENGEWEKWVLYMLKGVEETANWTRERIQKIRWLQDATIERCRKELPKIYSKELVEIIFRQPYARIQFLVEAGIAKRQTASVYLQELEKAGFLAGEKHGREIIYKHPALLQILAE